MSKTVVDLKRKSITSQMEKIEATCKNELNGILAEISEKLTYWIDSNEIYPEAASYRLFDYADRPDTPTTISPEARRNRQQEVEALQHAQDKILSFIRDSALKIKELLESKMNPRETTVTAIEGVVSRNIRRVLRQHGVQLITNEMLQTMITEVFAAPKADDRNPEVEVPRLAA